MENGWVYWSNWAGLTDVASGIQIQRGLGASKLAVPSVGGTVSIFTKSAELEQGGSFYQLMGNDGYSKSTVSYNTGVNDNGWATSFLLTKWSGNGYIVIKAFSENREVAIKQASERRIIDVI